VLKSSGLYRTKLIVRKELVIVVAHNNVVGVSEVLGLEFCEGAFPDERGCLVLRYVGGWMKQN